MKDERGVSLENRNRTKLVKMKRRNSRVDQKSGGPEGSRDMVRWRLEDAELTTGRSVKFGQPKQKNVWLERG